MSAVQSTIASEEWRDLTPDVIGYPIPTGYQISSTGRFRSRRLHKGRIAVDWKYRDGSIQEAGYTIYRIRGTSGDHLQMLAHRLVAMAFIGPPPFPEAQVRHWDGNPRNNAVGNLLWGTALENAQDKERHGRTLKGEQVASHVLTEDEVLEIVGMFRGGLSQESIALRYNVTQANVSSIVNGKTWGFLTGIAATEPDPNHIVLNADSVSEIVQRHRSGESRWSLAKQFGVSYSTVKAIFSGRAWSSVTGFTKRDR